MEQTSASKKQSLQKPLCLLGILLLDTHKSQPSLNLLTTALAVSLLLALFTWLYLVADQRKKRAQKQADLVLQESHLRMLAQNNVDIVIEACPNGILSANKDGIITLVNRSLEETFGYTRAELIGMPVEILIPSHIRKKHVMYRTEFNKMPTTRQMGQGRDLFGIKKDGTQISVEVGLNPLADGKVLASIVDITTRKEAESLLKKRHKELERSNSELDQFAYVASHDLRSPLRAISNYADWVLKDAGDKLPTGSKEHLLKLRSRVEKMDELLNDLLAYSRANRMGGDLIQIQTSNLIRDVLNFIGIPGGFTIKVADNMPEVKSPKVPLELVFRNLISNAIKHHDRKNGNIEINASTDNAWCMFTVADDGPGIPGEYHEKIFEMFQSLKHDSGSGMGLALVKKIVGAHGGEVKLKSEEGKGSSFSFTWPKECQNGYGG